MCTSFTLFFNDVLVLYLTVDFITVSMCLVILCTGANLQFIKGLMGM